MAYSVVGSISATGTSASTVTTGSLNTTGADLLVAGLNWFTGNTATISDSKGNTWNKLTSQVVTRTEVSLFWSRPTSVGTGHTFTGTIGSGGGCYGCLAVLAVSGSVASPLDVQNGSSNTTGATTCSTGSITPTANGELLVAVWGMDDPANTGACTISSGFTIAEQHSPTPGALFGDAFAYLIQGTAGAINPTFTRTNANSGSGSDVTRIAAFKVAAGGTTFNLSGSATQAQSLTLPKQVQATRSLGQTQAISLARAVRLTRALTQGQSLSIAAQKVFLRVVTTTQAQVLMLAKQARLSRALTQAQVALTLRLAVVQALALTQTTALALGRAVRLTRSLTEVTAITITLTLGAKTYTITVSTHVAQQLALLMAQGGLSARTFLVLARSTVFTAAARATRFTVRTR